MNGRFGLGREIHGHLTNSRFGFEQKKDGLWMNGRFGFEQEKDTDVGQTVDQD